MDWTVWTSERLPETAIGGDVETGVVSPTDGTWLLAARSLEGGSQSWWGQASNAGGALETVTLEYERG